MTAHAKWKEEKELRNKKISEAATAVVELLKTKSLTFDEADCVLTEAKETIRTTTIVD